MYSIFNEIEKIHRDQPINIIETLSNRYTLLCKNLDGTKTAFCFAVPIRNIQNNNIVDLRFHHNKNQSFFLGSNTKITITDRATLMNQYGQCNISFDGNIFKKTEDTIFFKKDNQGIDIHPTLNGLLFIMDCNSATDRPQLTVRFDRIFDSIWSNDKCFSAMRDTHIPFLTVSCIGAIHANGSMIAPCTVCYHKCNDFEYCLTFSASHTDTARIAIEINMHETKLFQDTTVESLHPKSNNAFGGTAFLGHGKEFGEQWLYTRLEISNISQFQNKKILKTILHIPQLSPCIASLTTHKLSTRFCSFGSNWENKIATTDFISESQVSNGYYHLDMTKLFGNLRKNSENFLIRTSSSDQSAIIPTGDAFYAPQILEIKYQ